MTTKTQLLAENERLKKADATLRTALERIRTESRMVGEKGSNLSNYWLTQFITQELTTAKIQREGEK